MSTLFDNPARLAVRCDARLKPMLAALAKARRQPPGCVLEQLVEAEMDRLRSAGRLPGHGVAPSAGVPQGPTPLPVGPVSAGGLVGSPAGTDISVQV
ncbi:MAG: hypothetical protein M0Z30_03085 [Actinomycetota bacterium]|nr:hypothetical protein [Actinomycetota bacterium]